MRGDLLLKALAVLEVGIYNTTDFMGAFLSSSKSNYLPLRNFSPSAEPILTELLKQKILERTKFHSVFQKLRKEDLITQDRKKKIWQVTQKGKEKLLQLIKQRGSCPKKYVAKISDEVVIVSFDVPEKNRTKRNWLRHVLKEMNFTMIQKSVWLAKLRLPKEFIEDLRLFKLLPCVQIFSVNKSGTIENIA